MKQILLAITFALFGFIFSVCAVHSNDPSFKLGATTSAYDTGLLPLLRREFRDETGIDIKLVIKGTGRVLDIARRGDVDALLVHDAQSELEFIADGYAEDRHQIMYNDFVVVGPKADPAGIRDQKVIDALTRLAAQKHAFASRGDNSGTHKAELRMWKSAGLSPDAFSRRWYKSLGSGMGATLNTASALNAYSLTDRGTWLAFKNKLDLEILVQDDPPLRNVYSIMLVSPDKYPGIGIKPAQTFLDWIKAEKAQRLIDGFRKQNQQLFYPLIVTN